MNQRGWRGLATIGMVVMLATRAVASRDTAPLAGVAVDPQGAALPGVTVTVMIADRAGTQATPLLVITDGAGVSLSTRKLRLGVQTFNLTNHFNLAMRRTTPTAQRSVNSPTASIARFGPG